MCCPADRTQAIAALGAMSQMMAFPNLTHSDQTFISTTFTNFLPGMSMGLTKVATAGDTQNHRVTAVGVYLVILHGSLSNSVYTVLYRESG